MEAESRVHHRRLQGLRDLYDLARKRGALGVTTVAAAFADLGGEGGGNEPAHHHRRPTPR
jgi:hypothetical protein